MVFFGMAIDEAAEKTDRFREGSCLSDSITQPSKASGGKRLTHHKAELWHSLAGRDRIEESIDLVLLDPTFARTEEFAGNLCFREVGVRIDASLFEVILERLQPSGVVEGKRFQRGQG